jgi:hypothetical protein
MMSSFCVRVVVLGLVQVQAPAISAKMVPADRAETRPEHHQHVLLVETVRVHHVHEVLVPVRVLVVQDDRLVIHPELVAQNHCPSARAPSQSKYIVVR